MKKILTRGGVELIAVVLGITLSLWVDDKKELSVIKKNNVKTLESLKNEVRLRIDYIERKIRQYQRDVEVGEYVIKNWNNIDLDSVSIDKNFLVDYWKMSSYQSFDYVLGSYDQYSPLENKTVH